MFSDAPDLLRLVSRRKLIAGIATLVGSGTTLIKSLQSATGSVARLDAGSEENLAAEAAFRSVVSGELLIPPGIYNFAVDITITAQLVMAPGAILKPASGVKVNLEQVPIAGLHQIFDRSAGGAVQFVNSGTPEVFVEWWGARGGTGGRTNNDVPIQHAIDAVQSVIGTDFITKAPDANNSGGVVKFGRAAEYLCSGRIHTRNGVVLKGLGQFTVLKANAETWGPDTELWLSQNAKQSQFGCRGEMMTFDSSYIEGVRTVYAPAWQQNCGLRDCFVTGFKETGLLVDSGYGGSVGWEIENTLFYYNVDSAKNTVKCINVDTEGSYSVGWMNVTLNNVQFESGATSLDDITNQTGISVKGRVKLSVNAVHMEGIAYGIVLDTDACLYGQVISAGGNSSVREIIQCKNTWAGKIDVSGATKAGAQYLLTSYVSGAAQLYRDVEPIFGRIIYPNSPSEVLALCRNTSANPAILDAASQGFSAITRTQQGTYDCVFDTSKFSPLNGAHYWVRVMPGGSAMRHAAVMVQSAAKITIVFRDVEGSYQDCDFFVAEIIGRPGY
jgi:hypothetical protein